MPDNRSYRYYTDLERSHVVWNVVATPEFSLEPKTWCYPVVGCAHFFLHVYQVDVDLAKQQANKPEEDDMELRKKLWLRG